MYNIQVMQAKMEAAPNLHVLNHGLICIILYVYNIIYV